MRSFDRSFGSKHYVNEVRLLPTSKLLSMFFKAPWIRKTFKTVLFCGQKILKAQLFTDFLCKIARNSLTWIFI